MLALIKELYWTWYWNPGLVTLGFFAITLPMGAVCAFAAMVHDMVTYKEKTDTISLSGEEAQTRAVAVTALARENMELTNSD